MTDPALDLAEKETVLVVDDTPDNLSLMSGLLKDRYRIKVANNGEKALRIARSETPPDLILLDIMMPGLSGYEVCEQFKGDPATREIPIIFLTAMTATEDEKKGLELGAVDYITKPISPPIVLARVATHLKIKAAADFLQDKNLFLEQEVARRTREVVAIQDVTILTMASLAETRDSDTGNHIRRTQFYVKVARRELKDHPRFRHFLDDNDHRPALQVGAAPRHRQGGHPRPHPAQARPLHPGGVRDHEDPHDAGARRHRSTPRTRLGMQVDFLKYAKEIAYGHQEKWDGTGYPEGLGGDDIPISARLMAVADVYDALISRRVYKEGMPHEKAKGIMVEGRGTHFDPDVLDAFLAREEEILATAAKFRDSDLDLEKKAAELKIITGEPGN